MSSMTLNENSLCFISLTGFAVYSCSDCCRCNRRRCCGRCRRRGYHASSSSQVGGNWKI